MIKKLYERNFSENKKKNRDDSKIICKLPYFTEIRKLKLHQEFEKLTVLLRAKLKDSSLLRNVRLVVANPIDSNCFLETYKFNFIFNTML